MQMTVVINREPLLKHYMINRRPLNSPEQVNSEMPTTLNVPFATSSSYIFKF